jgi:hypothetical protein
MRSWLHCLIEESKMSRRPQPKLSPAERQRREERRHKDKEDEIVQATVGWLSSSFETARELLGQCRDRQIEIEIDVASAGLARDLWAQHPGPGAQLVPLVADYLAEQKRHAEAIEGLSRRLQTFADGDFQLIPQHTIDRAVIRQALFPPLDGPPLPVDRQLPTDSDRR